MSTKISGTERLARALSIQGSVLHALILRDLHMRFGRENIGFLWLIAEPLMLATVISGIHVLMGGGHGGDMHPGVFTLVGYCIFIVFRGIFNKAEGQLEASVQLLYHTMVTIFDIMLARTILETAGCFCAFVLLLGVFMLVGIGNFPARPLYLLVAFLLMGWWSFALSLIVTGTTFDSRTMGRMVHPISYFMIPLSGAFWTLSFIPEPYRSVLAWNPMVIIFEIARYGQFHSADVQYVSFGYVLTVNAILTYIGMLSIIFVKDKIHLS